MHRSIITSAFLLILALTGCSTKPAADSAGGEPDAAATAAAEPKPAPTPKDDPEAVAAIMNVTEKVRRDGDGLIIEVDYRGTSVADADLAPLTKLPRLRSVLLLGTPITGEALTTLAQIESLENLDLRDTAVDDSSLEHLVGHRRLKALRLSGKSGDCSVGDDGMAHVAQIPNLKVLALDFLWVSEDGLDALAPLQQLQEIYLAETTIGNEAIAKLAQFPQLKKVRLARNQIDASGLADMPKLTNLEELDLSECSQILDDAMPPLGELTKLKKLNLWRVNLTDAGIEPLNTLVNMEWLNLDNTRLTDAGMPYLSGMSKLLFLHLGSTLITDAGLDPLKNLKSLEDLKVTRTAVTQEGVDALKPSLPNTDIQLRYLGDQ
ncbi:Leucine Rich repeats (2 copies) [Rosistilla ulvae]|uniref:Leucine Rich repeats (2 copies) n=1 Tax=Rosistilla ulvae TaxID=1930277 RepID=A0A517LY27_9BACT|nr:hypothetical protein [Rosistilla ulvae]QDS87520.1 Leucine Rich repeats (2 copies) [Rosistilla ulvae]